MQHADSHFAHVLREHLARDVAGRILRHRKNIPSFLFKMQRPRARHRPWLRRGVQSQSGQQQLQLFIRTTGQHHAVLSEVQIAVHEHRTEIGDTKQRIAFAHKTTHHQRGRAFVDRPAHDSSTACARGRSWLRHQRSATAPHNTLISE